MQKANPPGEENAGGPRGVAPREVASSRALLTSSTWISRWQPAGPALRRCTRRKASPFSGTRVANSPEVPLAADKVDLVTSSQNEQAAANVLGGKALNPVTQRTATA